MSPRQSPPAMISLHPWPRPPRPTTIDSDFRRVGNPPRESAFALLGMTPANPLTQPASSASETDGTFAHLSPGKDGLRIVPHPLTPGNTGEIAARTSENNLQGLHGGETGIRTLGRLAPSTVFETAPFDHSGTSPRSGAFRRWAGAAQPFFCPSAVCFRGAQTFFERSPPDLCRRFAWPEGLETVASRST